MDSIFGKVSKIRPRRGPRLTSLSVCSVEAMIRPLSRIVVSIREGWGNRLGARAGILDRGKSATGIASVQIALEHILNDRLKNPERKRQVAMPG